jgi:hypothetical protein
MAAQFYDHHAKVDEEGNPVLMIQIKNDKFSSVSRAAISADRGSYPDAWETYGSGEPVGNVMERPVDEDAVIDFIPAEGKPIDNDESSIEKPETPTDNDESPIEDDVPSVDEVGLDQLSDEELMAELEAEETEMIADMEADEDAAAVELEPDNE